MTDYQLLEEKNNGKLFGYVQCNIEVHENKKAFFADFLPIFRSTLVGKIDIGNLLKTYAEEDEVLFEARKKLISGFALQNGTLITPLLLFYLQLGHFFLQN